MTELTPQSGPNQSAGLETNDPLGQTPSLEPTAGISATKAPGATEAPTEPLTVPVETPQTPPLGSETVADLTPPELGLTDTVLTNTADTEQLDSEALVENPAAQAEAVDTPQSLVPEEVQPQATGAESTLASTDSTRGDDAHERQEPEADKGLDMSDHIPASPPSPQPPLTEANFDTTAQTGLSEQSQETRAPHTDTAVAFEASRNLTNGVVDALGGTALPEAEGEATLGGETSESVVEEVIMSWVQEMLKREGSNRTRNEAQEYVQEVSARIETQLRTERQQQIERAKARIQEYAALSDNALRSELARAQSAVMELLDPEVYPIQVEELKSETQADAEAQPLAPEDKQAMAISAFLTETTFLALTRDADPKKALDIILSQSPPPDRLLQAALAQSFQQLTYAKKYQNMPPMSHNRPPAQLEWRTLMQDTQNYLKHAAGKPATPPPPAETQPSVDDSDNPDPTS